MVQVVGATHQVAGDGHPDTVFMLGFANATVSPPRMVEAVRQLKTFIKGVCGSAKASQFEEQCEWAQGVIYTLTGGAF